jgi:hypothetical protein
LTLKVVPKAACANEIVQRHWRKSTNESKKTEQKFDAAFDQFFRISKCFQRSKQKLFNFFVLNEARLKIKKNKTFASAQEVLI